MGIHIQLEGMRTLSRVRVQLIAHHTPRHRAVAAHAAEPDLTAAMQHTAAATLTSKWVSQQLAAEPTSSAVCVFSRKYTFDLSGHWS